jgi:hypothetical protein
MIEVPRNFMITLQTVNDFFHGALENFQWPISEQGTLALFLAVNRRIRKYHEHTAHEQEGKEGSWAPYINVLPKSFETVAANLPVELQMCLPLEAQEKIATQMHKARIDLADARRFVDSLDQSSTCAVSSCSTFKSTFTFTDSDFFWGWFAVNTRCITLDTKTRRTLSAPRGTPTMFLAPFIDLFNHSFDADIDASYDSSSKSFKIATNVPYGRGTQCFIQYGPHDNVFLLCEYGFVIGGGGGSDIGNAGGDGNESHVYGGDMERKRNPYDHVLVDQEVEAFRIPNERKEFRERIIKELKDVGMYGYVLFFLCYSNQSNEE